MIRLPNLSRVPWLVTIVVLGLLGNALLLATPGYFSHDELQWGASAWGPVHSLHWIDPLDISPLQYRPLTFNLWLLISNQLFPHPHAYHLLWVAMGIGNALLLFTLLRRLGLEALYAAAGSLIFLFNPFSTYVHGWVGTLGDVLWLAALLCISLLAIGQRRGMGWQTIRLALIGLLTLLALLAKESAIVIPGLCALAWLLFPERRHWLGATIASGIPVLAYLVLRMHVLAEVPQDSSYAWQPANIPHRWLEYQLFAFSPLVPEPQVIAHLSVKRLLIPAIFVVALHCCLARVHWRLALALLLGSVAVLGPVLMLGFSAGQYGYGFGMLLAASGAVAAQQLRHRWRLALGVAGVVLLLHGVVVQAMIYRVGMLESRFSPQLAALASQAGPPLRLQVGNGPDWAYRRLSHEIPAYQGRRYLREVQIVGADDPADHQVSGDGSILPINATQP